jgi:hypothetical protein
MSVLLPLNFHALFYKKCKLCLRISVSYLSCQYKPERGRREVEDSYFVKALPPDFRSDVFLLSDGILRAERRDAYVFTI